MPVRYLILALTNRCNLQCRYCYNGDPSAAADMSPGVVERAIHLAVSDGKPFHLQLTGGEPTLLPDLIERAAVCARESGQCSSIGIQTNGTRLTPDLTALFKRYQIQVGISLDGPPRVHERMRGMAAETLGGLQLLEADGIPFRVTTVVTRTNVTSLSQLVLMLAGFAFARGIGLDLLVNRGRARDSHLETPADTQSLQSGLKGMLSTLNGVNARRAVPLRLRELDLLMAARKKGKSFFVTPARGKAWRCIPTAGYFPAARPLAIRDLRPERSGRPGSKH